MDKDVLSQSEIDSLIKALNSGDLPAEVEESDQEGDSTLYDFRRPNKFSKEQLRTLKLVHENFSRILANFLSVYLRTPVKVKLESVSQVTYEEFIFSLPLPTLVTVFSLSESLGNAMLETNAYFSFPIIDILFGGEGKAVVQNREMTEIEISVMKRVNEKILSNLKYAWEGIAAVSPQIGVMDTNPQFSQLIASNETIALLTFSTEICGNQGFINLCLPYVTLERVLFQLSSKFWFSSQVNAAADPDRDRERIRERLKKTEVELKAVLGKTTVTVEEFLNFEVGDVIILNNKVTSPVSLYLEDQPLFKVRPGALGGKIAGVVTEVLRKEVTGDE